MGWYTGVLASNSRTNSGGLSSIEPTELKTRTTHDVASYSSTIFINIVTRCDQ